MRLFALILALAVTAPSTAAVWEGSPESSPQSRHSSLQVIVNASDGSSEVDGMGIVFRQGWESDQTCVGCATDAVLTADADLVGLPNPALALQTITMAVTLPTLDILLNAPTIAVEAQVYVDHFFGTWTNMEGVIPADSFPHDRAGQWSFQAAGRVLIGRELLTFDYQYTSPDVAVAQDLTLGNEQVQMSGMLFSGSSAPAEVALGTVDGVEYTLALDAGFGTEQFIENLGATIVPEPSSAVLLGLGLLGLCLAQD